jgi:hypothetical protein
MNVHDDMTDSEVLRAAADSFSAIPMASPPDVRAIMARGRTRRARRLSALAGLSVAGAAAGTALVLGLTGVVGPARSPGTIQTASFTLMSNSNGTATLTISPKELLDAAALQSDLAQYGIPAKVTTGSLCSSDPAPAGFSEVVTSLPGPGTATLQPVGQPTLTIDPAAIPAGTELSIGIFQFSSGELSGEQLADALLINTSSYTCSATSPDPNGLPDGYGPSDGLGLLYGGPGPAG